MNKYNEFVVTIDIDWVPDFAINLVAEKLIEKNIAATWFVTHDSPAVTKLREVDFFELGIHPNFLPHSSHGNTHDEILEHMNKLVPGAMSTRSHAVVQSGPILQKIVNKTSVKIDSTIFLPDMPNIQPVVQNVSEKQLMRIPFVWSDDYALIKPEKNWDLSPYLDLPGLKVMLFHPLQIYLNQTNPEVYQELKNQISKLTDLDETTAKSFVNVGRGVNTFFDQLIDHLATVKTKCLKDFLYQ